MLPLLSYFFLHIFLGAKFHQISINKRKKIYDNTDGINPELKSAVDQDLYLKLYEMGNFTFIKQPLYLYRLHANGVSQDLSKKIKLTENWQKVIVNTAKRRNIKQLYGKNIAEIDNLPAFLKNKQNDLFAKILRKFS